MSLKIKKGRSMISISINGNSINVNAPTGGGLCVTTVNGVTTVTLNGQVVSPFGAGNIVIGNSVVNAKGTVVQTVNTCNTSIHSQKPTVQKRSKVQRRTAKGRAGNRQVTVPKRSNPSVSIEEIKNCFVELDQAYSMGAADISDEVIRGIAGCKTVCKNATEAENKFKALKEKMSGAEYPIYILSEKPKAGKIIADIQGNGVCDGYCILNMPRDTVFEGTVREGKMCGYGSLITPKFSFAGLFDNNKEAQRGIYSEAEGVSIMISDGYGIFVKNNTLLAMGQIKNKKLNGYGIDLRDTKNIKCGKFKNGELV